MKKAVSIFLVLAMAVGCFAGCGSKEAKKDADKFYIGGIGPVSYTHLDVYKRQS